ncbi:hypothetical protein B0H13DRAFT_2658059 [Mycena leptocephala]|nr:hypothetical protein B0H13DRAFT_2658059 [Mycena leptocephala]
MGTGLVNRYASIQIYPRLDLPNSPLFSFALVLLSHHHRRDSRFAPLLFIYRHRFQPDLLRLVSRFSVLPALPIPEFQAATASSHHQFLVDAILVAACAPLSPPAFTLFILHACPHSHFATPPSRAPYSRLPSALPRYLSASGASSPPLARPRTCFALVHVLHATRQVLPLMCNPVLTLLHVLSISHLSLGTQSALYDQTLLFWLLFLRLPNGLDSIAVTLNVLVPDNPVGVV